MVVLNSLDMWVEMHGLKTGFKTGWALREVVKYIGTLVTSDPNNFSGVWRDYLRMRVTINVAEPLKRRMKFRKRNGEAFYAYFKYEKVPTFCFICGIMGHVKRFCNKVYGIPADQIVKPYSLDMKAPTRRQNFLTASPWLRSGKEDNREEHQEFTPTAANPIPDVNARPNNQAKSKANFDSVIAQSHNSGKQYSSHNDHVILVNENTAGYSNEELIEISDLKRKIKESILSSGAEQLVEERMETEVVNGPNNSATVANSKNLDKVGLGLQAHQTL
uniref:Zinc knuckle CX2CX4HX4C domain-containing protein n=1 Tax=Cannabis sativa TaxID=3483 RepID=A0A803Q019_CANSA